MCVSRCRWTGRRGPRVPVPLIILLLPLSFLSSTPPFAQGAIEIPKEYKVQNMSQPPVLTETPSSFTAFYRDDISLTCEASGNPTPSFRWVKDGRPFGEEMTGSGTVLTKVGDPLEHNQGLYRCYASNLLGTAMTQVIRIITEAQPFLPKQYRSKKTAYEGESLILSCKPPHSSTQPVIHWMDKSLVHITQSERVTVGLDGNLYFANLLKSDSRDDYKCNAEYTEARTILLASAISLNITATNDVMGGRRPHFFRHNSTPTQVLALKGEKLVLECIAKGLPTPQMEWKKKDTTFGETSGTIDNFGHWFAFKSIVQGDDGEYECLASNEHGSAAHSFIVTVEAAPYWVKEPQNQLYAPGETVRLDCQAEGFPTPNVTWSINGQPLAEVDEDPRRSASGGTMILRDVVFADTAVYQCEATNKHGSIILNTFIYVIELPPQILSSDGMVYRVTEGGDIKMRCDSFGSPRPHVTWEGHDTVPLLSDPRVSLLTDGTIELSDVTHDDSGSYFCSVKHSNISITAHLEVFNRTAILTQPQDVRAVRGSNALLDCRFYKDPQLVNYQIVWRKDGAKLQESSPDDKYTVFENGTLKVTHVQSEDTASYSCEVITDLDHAEASGSITAIARPEPPKNLSLSDVQDNSLTLSWIPGRSHNSPISEFIIQAREEQHTEEGKWKWEEWKTVSGDVNHLELTLQPYCTYRFRVISVNEVGSSDSSKPSEYYSTPPAVPYDNPTGVRSNSEEKGTLSITWDEMDKRQHNGQDFQYKVFWRESGGKNLQWSQGYAKAPPFTVNDTGIYTAYEIKVQAVNSLGDGPLPLAEIGHSGEDKPLEGPTGVTVAVQNSTIRVGWNEAQRVQGLLLGYKIYISRLGPQGVRRRRSLGQHHPEDKEARVGKGKGKDEDVMVVVVHGKKTWEDVPGLRLYSMYVLSVAAFNSKGDGPHSEPFHFSTPEGAPGPPASLTFESPSDTSLILHWTPPLETNGKLLGYVLHYVLKADSSDSLGEMEIIRDPTVTHFELNDLDPNSHYDFKLMARTGAGKGPAILMSAITLLDGVPPSNVTMVPAETSVNLSWVPGDRHRNHAFHIRYLRKSAGGQWEESESINSTQGFYALTGLQAGTQYHLLIMHGNYTQWEDEIWTTGPELSEVAGGFATQGWFIGLISAIVLLMLILLILCFIKRSRGGKYAVKDKEDKEVDSEARPMKDETFGEYRSLESDADEKRSDSQPSLCGDSKLGSDDSLAEYGDSVDIQFNEDGSFIGQYSGRGPAPHGNESSGPASPVNPVPPPPIAPSMSSILNRPS